MLGVLHSQFENLVVKDRSHAIHSAIQKRSNSTAFPHMRHLCTFDSTSWRGNLSQCGSIVSTTIWILCILAFCLWINDKYLQVRSGNAYRHVMWLA